jgi:ATP-dependent Clp protease protease subunit
MRNRIRALLSNRVSVTAPRFEVSNDAQASEATIYLYDVIDAYWGISAADFVKAIAGISAETIHLRINSPGGDVFEARAMATALRQHKAKVIAHIDGLAASCASWIALAADEVEISAGAFYMIHRSWSYSMGNAADLRAAADLLEKVDEELVAEYVRETGATDEQVRAWLDAETWFTADEAVTHKFADRLASDAPKDTAAWDVSAFARAPKDLLERPAKNIAATAEAEHTHAYRARMLRTRERQFS